MSLNPFCADNTQQKKGLPSGRDPCLPSCQEGQYPEGHLSAPQLQLLPAALPPPIGGRAAGSPAAVPTSPGVPLDNIALFLSLRLFSFSIENAKYLEG